ncbi:hypothetical protein [Flammeovirga sp. SubArs3]|uniref:hypothetical protein n=1 Tax=Flammeovirga sp. SubArs3 TaxID=2995316 RepID=UPI00248AD517|nr:hypothetical protein [Flammeovirga sp. SubArs3]
MKKFTKVLLALLSTFIFGNLQSYASEILEEKEANTINDSIPKPMFTYNFAGRIHKSLMLVDDGGGTLVGPYVMDSDQAPSRLKLVVQSEKSLPFYVGANVEVAMQSRRPSHITQEQANPGSVIRMLASELTFGHEKFGFIDVGIGLTSSTMFLHSDLSGIANGNILILGLASQGLYFRDRETEELSDTQIRDYFYTPERMLITDRVRYRSPVFFNGLEVQASISTSAQWDAAINYFKNYEQWDFRSYISYEHQPSPTFSGRTVLGISGKHHATGLSISSLFSTASKMDDMNNSNGYIVRLGIERNWWKYGSTSFVLDYSEGFSIGNSNDKIESLGVYTQQKINPLNFDIYAGIRTYSVFSTENSLLPIKTYTMGLIFTF